MFPVNGSSIDEMNQDPGPLNMPQKLGTKTGPLMGAFN
jgi:hypothetical protein